MWSNSKGIENWNAGGRGGELSPEEVRTMLQTLKKKKDCGKVTRHLESGDNLWDEFSKQRSILESEGDCSGFEKEDNSFGFMLQR